MTATIEQLSTVEGAVQDRLVDDPVLSSLLAVQGDAPAVFPDIHVPGDVGYPFIAIVTRSAASDGSKTTTGYEWQVDLRCFGSLTQLAEVAAVAGLVRELMHHNPIDVGEWTGWLAVADAPVPVAVIGAICRQVSVRLRAAF
ncbi:MAG: DUF3168 domain-containing protein [Chloroflexi bacterium]|nr:DUF3168 domain-containing protein [Chloroflexota bacterium]